MSNLRNNIKAFVCGFPINHSRSPIVHSYWLKRYNIEGSYEAIEIEPSNLDKFITTLELEGYAGGNFTIPHKEKIFDLVPEIDEVAKTIGAVNTIWFEGGKLRGTNTDAYGFAKNLDEYQSDWSKNASQKSALVLGAGGASRAILIALLERDFEKIYLANRTVEKAAKLATELSDKISPIALDTVEEIIENISLLVNTTSVGMKPNDGFPFSISKLPKEAVVTDIVYTPLETKLLQEATAQGNPTVDGLGMLLHQAVPGFEKWFGVKPEVTEELRDLIIKDLKGH